MNNPSRTFVRSIAVAAAVALAFGSTATSAQAADLDPTPTPDFTVVAAWADPTAAPETDYVLVKDAAGLHRFAGDSWTAVNIPAAGKQFAAAPRPVILGSARVGGVLVALPGRWRPVPVKFTVWWYRGGVAIPGATKVIYHPTRADRGSRITVAVTGSKSGYVTTTEVSAPTRTIG